MVKFGKYHGCGNDFLIIGETELARAGIGESDLCGFARAICHRQLGVGADGLIVARGEPLTMDIVNSDGSVAPMCGNGIRCFARYCLETGLVPEGAGTFEVQTLAGLMRVSISSTGGGGFAAEIGMGRPDWSARAAGIDENGEFMGRVIDVGAGPACGGDRQGSAVGGTRAAGDAEGPGAEGHGDAHEGRVRLSSLFLGTYHTVVWLDENEWILGGECGDGGDGGDGVATGPVGSAHGGQQAQGRGNLYGNPEIDRVGRALESHPIFKERTNVNFARITGRDTVEMITWERGAGLTAACGTGATSVVALGLREGRLGGAGVGGAGENPRQSATHAPFEKGAEGAEGAEGGGAVRVVLPYGELSIRQGAGGEMYMRGPAEHVFDGEYRI